MFQPKKLKFRKFQSERILSKSLATKGYSLVYGKMGLKACEGKMINDKHLNACVNELKRRLGKKGRFWLRIFTHIPKTKKPPETRMGGGKGDIEKYVTFVKAGNILFEVDGLDDASLKNALRLISYKLPLKTKIVSR